MTLTPLRDDRVLGPLREYLAELGPLAEAAVVEWLLGLQEPPRWARVLGPWQPYLQARSMARFEVGRDTVGANVWPKDDGSGWVYWSSQGHRQVGPFETRAAAMNAADAAAITEGYLHDNVRPPEEPPPAPAPAPAHEVGSGRRAGEHRWSAVEELGLTKRSIYPVILSRCEDCRLWRVGGRRYFPADMRPEGVRLLWREDGAGTAKAGRCPGRQP